MLRASVVAALLLFSQTARAHDLYLVTGVAGAGGRVCARVGEHFPVSMNAVTADRLQLFRLLSAAGGRDLAGKQDGKQFCAPLGAERHAIAEMIVQPRFIKLSGEEFTTYIDAEGFHEVLRMRREAGAAGQPGTELYSRYAKLVIGDVGDVASNPVGHYLEIVPLKNPARMKPGESLAVRVLLGGKPLPRVRVAAAYAGAPMKGHAFPVAAETDEQGTAQLQLDRGGLWYARLIHMVSAQGDPEIAWRSYFATLTVTLPPSSPSSVSP